MYVLDECEDIFVCMDRFSDHVRCHVFDDFNCVFPTDQSELLLCTLNSKMDLLFLLLTI